MASNLAGPSGCQIKKNTKIPIIGEERILTELFENSGSDLEDLSQSDSEYLPSDTDVPNTGRPSQENNISESESDSEPQIEVPNFITNIARQTRGNRRARGRARAQARGRARGQQNRGPRRRAVRYNINYEEDAALGWRMPENDEEPVTPDFTATPAINTNLITDEKSAYEIFSIFFDAYIFDIIKVQTNKYARDRIDKEIRKEGQLKRKSLLANWKAVTNSELKIFFSIIIHMSLVVKPTLKHYWSLNSFYSEKYCKVVGMSRDRFLSILSMFHLNDNATYKPQDHPDHDNLHKIRPIHDHILNLFRNIYIPKENITIDEGMCPFRGRLHFRVYIKGKPHKYGIKLYMVCEAESGYCANFEIYTGATTVTEETEDTGIINSLVHRLLDSYENKGYCVYLDRFFSGPVLFDSLWNVNIKAVGTVMASRTEMPKKAFKNYKLYKGEYIFRRRDHLLAMKWKDKRDVLILSTIHKAEMLPSPSYHHPDEPPKLKPSAVLSYNKNKVGVDRSDQLLSYNSFKRKTIKWWKKLFFHLFDLTIINSLILYNKSHPESNMTLVKFYEAIGNGLLGDAGINLEEEAAANPIIDAGNLRLVGKKHFPVYVPATANKPQGRAHRVCKVCSDTTKYQTGKRGRTETRYMCEQCETPLCIVPCFKKFHNEAKYWQ